jgi:beta-mannosidase
MSDEARRIIPTRRNHPSLAIWGGGNELASPDGVPLDEHDAMLHALQGEVRRHDPDRAWLPTSPSGPTALFRGAPEADAQDLHDVHGPWEHQGLAAQRRLWGGRLGLLHSEYGAPGMTSAEVLERTVSEEHRWPQTRAAPVIAHRGDWWIDEPMVRASFGAAIDGLDTLRRASRYLQADGIRTAVEAIRSGWPRTSGSLPWQFDESFPNAWSTAAVDHSGRPKPAYHAVKGAYRETGVAARVECPAIGGRRSLPVEAWAWTEGARREAVIRLSVTDASGRSLATAEISTLLDPDAVAGPHRVSLGLRASPETVVCLDAWLDTPDGGTVHDGDQALHRYLLTRAEDLGPLLRAPTTTLKVAAGADGHLEVRNAGPTLAIGVEPERLPDDASGVPAVALTGPLHLLPGESATIAIAWRGVAAPERRCLIRAWNSEPVAVRWGP